MLADEPMASLMVWVIEGKHYKVENGLAVVIPEMESDYVDAVHRVSNHERRNWW